MNELLTGGIGGLEFGVRNYTSRRPGRPDIKQAQDKNNTAPIPKTLVFGVSGDTDLDLEDWGDSVGSLVDKTTEITTTRSVGEEAGLGPTRSMDLDDMVEDFDTDQDISSSRCTVCFGSGFVGGYSVLYGWRKCLVPHGLECYSVDGTIETVHTPNKFFATSVVFNTVLPKGFVYLDAFSVWDNADRVYPTVTIDDLPMSPQLVAAFCDGRPHRIQLSFPDLTYFTHLEIQIGLSTELALLEFPKLSSSSRTELRDLTDDVSIVASPVIPKLSARDVLVESSFGKAFIVGPSTAWNTKDRTVMGWEVTARVIQSAELLSLLPRRRKLNQLNTNMVRDNQNRSNRRT
jgi:hypothetical protein